MDSSAQNNPNNPPKNTQRKKGKGRKKTSTGRIENETRRQVTFSKRRSGLFKKANEIGTLCGAENAVVVDSPGGKFHSFGCPNVETVAKRYLNRTNGLPRAGKVHDHRMLAAYSEELANLESQLEWEKKYKKESKRMIKEMQAQEGIPHNPDKLNYQQLVELLKNASSLKQELETMKQDPYAQGSINPDTGVSNASYPLNPITKGPSCTASLGPGGYSNYPNLFDIGSGSNNSNVVVFPNNPGANNPNATFLTVISANPGFVEPFNSIMASNLGLPFQYPPPSASGSNPMFPFYYGNPSAEAQRGRQSSNGRGRGN